MAFNPHHPILTTVALLLLGTAVAQPSPPSNDNYNGLDSANFKSSSAVVIVVVVSCFFFLAFFSLYIRQCSFGRSSATAAAGNAARVFVEGGRLSRRNGLEPAVLETYPTFAYSEVRELKFGKEALECAVCLSEFSDDEVLRLLPACNHVFHVDCIDVWLASHVTCPVCRTDLAAVGSNSSPKDEDEETTPAQDHVAISIAGEGASPPDAAAMVMARTGSLKEEAVALWTGMFGRSHTTGHSVAAAMASDGGCDRYTLRLPEHVRREIVEAGRLRRATSCVGFAGGGEASARRGYRTGGRSDRWAAKTTFLARALSMRVPAWAAGRRGDVEGSRKKGAAAAAEGSSRRVFPAAVKGPFDCLGGGGGDGATTDDEESSTVAFARVDTSVVIKSSSLHR